MFIDVNGSIETEGEGAKELRGSCDGCVHNDYREWLVLLSAGGDCGIVWFV